MIILCISTSNTLYNNNNNMCLYNLLSINYNIYIIIIFYIFILNLPKSIILIVIFLIYKILYSINNMSCNSINYKYYKVDCKIL